MTALSQRGIVVFIILSVLQATSPHRCVDYSDFTSLRSEFRQQMAVLTNLTSHVTALTEKVDSLQANPEQLSGNTTSCIDWLNINRASGIRTVYVSGNPIVVYCDQTTDGGGWIVFQRRKDASVDFYRNWTEYRNGFGDMEDNFWLGLDKLHSLTTSQRYELRVDLQKWGGTKGHATYSGFYVEGVGHNFVLHFDNFTGGNAGDSFSVGYNLRGMQFSTKDRDHDTYSENCAQLFKGAWWYSSCQNSNLNGLYINNKESQDASGLRWYTFGPRNMKFCEMKIRPL